MRRGGKHLGALGASAVKARLPKADAQLSVARQRSLEETSLKIKQRAKEEGSGIHWKGETTVANTGMHGHG